MVDHAEYLIGVFDNQKKLRSGTAQTVNYALHQGKVITLIRPFRVIADEGNYNDNFNILVSCLCPQRQQLFSSPHIHTKIPYVKSAESYPRYSRRFKPSSRTPFAWRVPV